jgi:hypothetical protein
MLLLWRPRRPPSSLALRRRRSSISLLVFARQSQKEILKCGEEGGDVWWVLKCERIRLAPWPRLFELVTGCLGGRALKVTVGGVLRAPRHHSSPRSLARSCRRASIPSKCWEWPRSPMLGSRLLLPCRADFLGEESLTPRELREILASVEQESRWWRVDSRCLPERRDGRHRC